MRNRPLPTAPRPAQRARRLALAGGALLALTPAVAAGQCEPPLQADLERALAARSLVTGSREQDVWRREADADLARQGLSASVGVRPGVGLGAGFDPEDPDLLDYQLEAGLSYRHDAVAIARADGALVTARTRLEAQRRTDVLDALLAMSRLRVALRAEAAAEAELATMREALARAEATAAERAADPNRAPLAGSAPDAQEAPLFLREARLQLRRAELDLEDARAATTQQRAVLADLGLEPPPVPDGECRLAPLEVPPPVPASNARAALEAALALSLAQLERVQWAPLKDVRFEAHYQEAGARATASLGVAAGRPDASLGFRLRPTGKDSWRVQLSANLRLDESQGAALAQARAVAEGARDELLGFEAANEAALSTARLALARAWAEVEVLDEALAIARARAADPAEERNRLRNAQAVGRAQDARERGLQAYLRAYAAYLGVSEAPWPVPR